jgi:Cys-rich four helix bundle protein (predicted Tat secretion target)
MKRRNIFGAACAAILMMTAGFGAAQTASHNHDYSAAKGPNQSLVDAASICTKAGLACTSHCLESLAAGDLTLAACARSVDEMSRVCGTLAKLGSTGSVHLAAMAKVALADCQDCEKECRKHAERHATCKACADACASCAEECKKQST